MYRCRIVDPIESTELWHKNDDYYSYRTILEYYYYFSHLVEFLIKVNYGKKNGRLILLQNSCNCKLLPLPLPLLLIRTK